MKKWVVKALKFFLLFFPSGFLFSRKGYCPCCEKRTRFFSKDPWLRDHLVCLKCSSIPRERALMVILDKIRPDWRALRIHESSPGNLSLSLKLQRECPGYVGTQYYAHEKPGERIGKWRNENLEDQTFDDNAFDIVITQDVFEHIGAPEKAFQEIHRTLKNDGIHIFTVPLVNKTEPSLPRLEKDSEGRIHQNFEKEFHGNPIDSKGSLVTMHWGYDIVKFIETKTGDPTRIFTQYDLDKGICGEYIDVLVTTKNKKEGDKYEYRNI